MIVRFEPGDATSYRVLLHVLSAEEARAVGGVDAGAYLFGFSTGGMRPLRAAVFQPGGFIDQSYYAEQMGSGIHHWTLRAGIIVLAYLTGRDYAADDPDIQRVLAEWHEDWQDQLLSLLPELQEPS
mgnify:CR=1 FL=1